MRHASRGIILAKENFSEADQYVQFLTRDWGVITALARSARKSKRRYVGGLDLFCHDEIFLRGAPKERPYLVELSVLNSFMGLRNDLEKIMAAGRATQWVRKLADAATPMPGVYRLLGQTLALLEKESGPERLGLLELVYRIRLLSSLGLKPRVQSCARCGSNQTGDAPFDVESGGIVCRICLSERHAPEMPMLDPEERQLMEYADQMRLTFWGELNFPLPKVERLNRLVSYFASYHTHSRLPT